MRIGLLSVVFLIFLVLKLAGVIAWSWWWVTAPLWISAIVIILMLVITGIITVQAHNRYLNKRF